MRCSTILSLLGASLVVATPVNHDRLHKKAIVYDFVTDLVYVTVTQNAVPTAPAPTTVHVQHTVIVNAAGVSDSTTSAADSSTSSIVQPIHSHSEKKTSVSSAPTTSSTLTPASISTSEPPAPPTEAPVATTEAPAPAPTTEASSTTTEAPVPTIVAAAVHTTSQAPVEVPTTTSTPVVEVAATTEEAAATSSGVLTTFNGNSFTSTGTGQHNTCRASHSGNDVAWNATLAGFAATTAQTCVFAHDMSEGGGGYGQNIASQGSSSETAWTAESALENAIISEWYSEASMFTSLYGQESPSGGGDWLHFTQIVWKDSLEIGCAVAACPTTNSIFPGMYTWFTVCNYYPQGNILGEFAENVLSS